MMELFHFVTSFGVFEVFSEPFVGLNKASVKSERQTTVTSQYNNNSKGTLNATKHMQSKPECLSWKRKSLWKAWHLQMQRGCSPWPRCTQREQAELAACCSRCAGRCDGNLQAIKQPVVTLEQAAFVQKLHVSRSAVALNDWVAC